MQKWFCVRAGGLKADDHMLQSMTSFEPAQLLPKLIVAAPSIEKLKRGLILAIGGAKVPVMKTFADVQSRYHRFVVDPFDFLRFSGHGYTPLLASDYQPTRM